MSVRSLRLALASLALAAAPAAAQVRGLPVINNGAGKLVSIGADIGFGEPIPAAAWKTLPSWFAVATQDMTIGADALRFFAERMGAVTIEIDASHVVFISQPEAITDLIISALGTIG